MNSNKTIKNLYNLFLSAKNSNALEELFSGLFTQNELETLTKRWRILQMLNKGATQRQIATELNVSLCKVTRGARVIKENKLIANFLNESRK